MQMRFFLAAKTDTNSSVFLNLSNWILGGIKVTVTSTMKAVFQ